MEPPWYLWPGLLVLTLVLLSVQAVALRRLSSQLARLSGHFSALPPPLPVSRLEEVETRLAALEGDTQRLLSLFESITAHQEKQAWLHCLEQQILDLRRVVPPPSDRADSSQAQLPAGPAPSTMARPEGLNTWLERIISDASASPLDAAVLVALKALVVKPKVMLDAARQGLPEVERRKQELSDLDRALHTCVVPEMLAILAPQDEATARCAEIANLQRRWVERLRQAGLTRIAAEPGAPLDPGRIEPSGESDRPTSIADRAGRVAGVTPGNGGYEFQGRVLQPARVRQYAYQPDVSSGNPSHSGGRE